MTGLRPAHGGSGEGCLQARQRGPGTWRSEVAEATHDGQWLQHWGLGVSSVGIGGGARQAYSVQAAARSQRPISSSEFAVSL
jgi:hypothetical protein